MLALAFAAAFTTCTKENAPAEAPEMREVTLSVEVAEPADTRVAYTENDAQTAYQFKWVETDALYVYYNDGTKETAVRFSIDRDSISEDGKKADFVGVLPNGFTGVVTMVYGGNEAMFKRLGEAVVYDGVTLTDLYGQTSCVEEDLAARTFLYAKAKVTDGILPNVKLQHMISYLLLKAGLQVTQEGLTLDKQNPSELRFQFSTPSLVKFTSSSYEILETKAEINKIYIDNGKLVEDCLVPIFVGPQGLKTKLPMTGYLTSMSESNAATITEQTEYTYQPGKMYVVQKDNEKWQSLVVPTPDPLTLEAIDQGGTITFDNKASGSVIYKVNGVKGGEIASGSMGEITVVAGDKVQFFGNNKMYSDGSESNTSTIQCSTPCFIYGNIMSLCAAEDYGANISAAKSLGDSAFRCLFYNNTNIRNHPEKKLLLPATFLNTHCYHGMFFGCTGLTEAPDLLARDLKEYCYYAMFYGCINLIKAPEVLPAPQLRDNCYAHMFYSCTTLTTAPVLPARTLVKYCYQSMFYNCNSLVSLTCFAEDISATRCADRWLYGTRSGFFYGVETMKNNWPNDDSGVPRSWYWQSVKKTSPEYLYYTEWFN